METVDCLQYVPHPVRVPSPEAFERALAELSQPALAAFVADLWAARGWETRVESREEGVHVVCTRADETTRILLAERRSVGATLRRAVRNWLRRDGPNRPKHGVSTDTHATVDVVVSPVPDAHVESVATDADARVHDARSLYNLARYGIDRPTADAIVRRHLGVEITTEPDPGRALGDPTRTDDEPVTGWRRWVRDAPTRGLHTLAVVVAAAAIVGVFAASVGPGFGGVAGDDVETGSVGGALGDGFEIAPGPAGGQGRVSGFVGIDPEGTGPPPGDGADSTASELAPGLGRDGVRSPDALAEAHAAQVAGRSYVWRVNYTEQTGDAVARARTVHRVRNASVLRVDVDTTGVLTSNPGRLVPLPAYADGRQRYVLSRGRVLERPLESRDHYAGHAEIVLSRLLHANESEVATNRDGRETAPYRLSLSGSPDPGRQAYRATALVTPDGVVHVVEAQWVDRESNVTVSVRTTYDFVEDPNVTRPDWMGPADEAPSDNSTTESLSSPTVER